MARGGGASGGMIELEGPRSRHLPAEAALSRPPSSSSAGVRDAIDCSCGGRSGGGGGGEGGRKRRRRRSGGEGGRREGGGRSGGGRSGSGGSKEIAAAEAASADAAAVAETVAVSRVLESLVMACTGEELRAALLEAVAFRSHPDIAPELQDARERLRKLKVIEAAEKKAAEKEADKDTCTICMNAASTHAFVPCGHRSLCQKCSETVRFDKCPICREPFEKLLRVYDVGTS